MRTLRRIYFYLVSALSLAVVIWGGTQLLHLLAGRLAQPDALASGLALTLVGAAVFALHWQACERYARQSLEDRNSWERAIFLYGMLAVTLLPVVFAVIATFGEQSGDLWSVPLNLLAAAFLYAVLRADWQQPAPERLIEVRRLAYYLWEFIGLGMLLTGAYRLLYWIADQALGYFSGGQMSMTLTLLAVGGAIWGWMQFRIRQGLLSAGEAEQFHPLRVWLYLVVMLTSAVVLAVAAIGLLAAPLNMLFGSEDWDGLLQILHDILPVVMLATAVGWYYYLQWFADGAALALPQRFGRYVLASFWYGFGFGGLLELAGLLVRSLRADVFQGESGVGEMLALVIVGTGLWLKFWPHAPNETESRQRVRRFFLYFWIFIGTVGLMVSGAGLLRLVLLFVLGGQGVDWLDMLQMVLQGGLFFATLWYYLGQLRQDQARTREQETVETPALRVALMPEADWLRPALEGLGGITLCEPGDAAVWILTADAIPSDAPEQVVKLVVPSGTLPNTWFLPDDDEAGVRAALKDALQRLQRGDQPQRPGLALWQKVLIGLGVLFALQWLLGFLVLVFSLIASL